MVSRVFRALSAFRARHPSLVIASVSLALAALLPFGASLVGAPQTNTTGGTQISTPVALVVDGEPLISDGNGVFESGERVEVAPAWQNGAPSPQFLTGTASAFTGPPGPTYQLVVDSADYGEVDPGQIASCQDGGMCYEMDIGPPGVVRPVKHWDTTFDETLSDGTTLRWTLHVGDSFADMPRTGSFYRFVETVLHHEVSVGCSDTEFCPAAMTSRAQMPVFVLRALEGSDYVPPPCEAESQVFADVTFDNPFCPWIEELFFRGVVSGCVAGNYCPTASVTRAQAAVFLLRTLEGADYTPPPCTGVFVDVPCPSPFGGWIEELFNREITSGCSSDPLAYCPAAPVTRSQMAVFLTRTFGLTLYGPSAQNNPPVVSPETFMLEENSAEGTVVGTVTFTDPNPGQSHTFAITAGNTDGAFAIEPSTGELTVANDSALDFETNPTFALTVEVTDDGTPPASGSATVTVELIDVNESPEVTPETFTLEEGSADGTAVGTVTFTDPDAGQSHTFVITAGNTDGAFAIGPTTGELTVANSAALDFETNPSFALTIEVTDDGTPPLSGSGTVTVELTDVNESPEVTPSTFVLAENSAAGTAAGTVIFTDPDVGQSHTFAITAGNVDGAFAIGASTGELTVANNAALDFETNPTFALTVEVTDDGTPPLSGSATVTVDLTDVNESPVVTPATFELAENSAAGTGAGTVIFTDPDGGQSHTFAITAGNTEGAFAIAPSTGELTVANSAALDFETNPTFALTVEVTDDGTPPLSGSATVTVDLTDVNELPEVTPVTFTLEENSAAGTAVGTVTFTDPDVGQSHTFAITAGNTGGAFAIGPTTGEIMVANDSALDFETNPAFALTVEVTDDGTPPLSGSATVTVELTDVNELPEVTPETFLLAENSASGTAVGTVTFADPDAGQSHTFAITAGNTDGAFAIGVSTGEITVVNESALDFETNSAFVLTVEVTDDGTPPLSGSATVTVELTNVNEPPTAIDDGAGTDEDTAIIIDVLVNDVDPDAGETLTIIGIGGSPAGQVTNNGTNVSYDPTAAFNSLPEGGSAGDSFTYTIADSGGLQSTATVSVTVSGLNDAPIAGDDAYSAIGNTQLAVEKDGPFDAPTFSSSLDDVLENDADPDIGDTIGVVPFSGTLPSGAELDLAADGSFFYTPPAGQTTPDSFTYTVEDSFGGTGTGEVTVDITKRVWYVDNSANGGTPGTGSGTATDPFSTLSDGGGNADPDDAEDASATGDILYVHQGDGTAANQNVGITLKAEQWLLGEGVDLVVDPDDGGPEPPATLFVGNPANRPQVVHSGAGSAVTVLASLATGDRVGIEIRGLELSSSSGNGVAVTSANAAGLGVRIADNVVSSAGSAGIDVNVGSTSAAQTLALHDNTVTATGVGLDISRTAGTLTITAFGDNAVTGATGGGGISVTGGSVIFDAVPGGSFDTVAGGTLAIGAPGDPVGGSGMALVGVSGDLTYTNINVYAGGGPGLRIGGTGSYTGVLGTRFRHLSPGIGVVEAVGEAAVDLDAITADLRLATLSSSSSSGSGVRLVNLVDGTGTAAQFSAGAGSSISSAAGTAFLVDGGNATVAYGGTIGNSSGRSVVVQNRTADTATFTGSVNDTGTGILLNSNAAGSTTSFQGGMTLSTGSNAAFTATSGGTVNVCDENPCNPASTGALVNTLTTTTGTALNVNNTTIGANNLELRSVTSNGGSNSGIVLNGTGSSGGLQVKGTGGTCTSAATCTGGAIHNKTVDGLTLQNTRDVSLSNMFIDNNDGSGIFGDDLTNFSLIASRVTNNADSTGGFEAGLRFHELLGNCAITNTTVANSFEDNMRLTPASGTLSNLQISGSTFGPTVPLTGSSGIAVVSHGTAVMTINVSNSVFPGNTAGGFLTTISDDSSLTLSIQSSDFTDGNIGIDLGTSASGDLTFTLNDNDVLRHASNAINIVGGNTASSQMLGTITNNRIGDGTADSGSRDAFGIALSQRGNPVWRMRIADNQVTNTDFEGIFVRIGDDLTGDTGTLDLTLTGNTVFTPDDNSGFPAFPHGLRVRSRQNTVLCANIANNESQGNNANGYHLQESDGSSLRLQGFTTNAQTTLQNNGNTTGGGNPTVTAVGEPFAGACTAVLP